MIPVGGETTAGLAVEADQVVVDDGVTTADGRVRIHLHGTTLRADHATTDGVVVRVGPGLAHGAVEASFTDATFDLRTGSLTLSGARIAGDGWTASGRSFELSDGRIIGVDARFSTCPTGCPWSVSARRVVATPQAVRASWGWLQVGPVALPTPPLRLPLEREPGLRFPGISVGYDGLRVQVPVFLPIADHDLTLTPELRTGRGVRLIADHDGPTGQTNAALGWDGRTGEARLGARWDERWSHGALSVATTGLLAGDRGYFHDYGTDYLVRRAPWAEARALAGFPFAEVMLNRVAWTHAADTPLVGIGSRLVEERGGFRGDGQLRLWLTQRGEPHARGRWMTDRPTRIGPLILTPRVVGEVRLDPTGARGDGAAGVDVGMPGWRSAGSATERLDPVVGVKWSLREATPRVRAGLGWRRTGWSIAEIRASVGTSPRGGTEDLRVTWQGDRWLLWSQADGVLGRVPHRAAGGVRLQFSPIVVDVAAFHAPKIAQVRGRIGLDGDLRPSVGAIVDLHGKLRSIDAGFSWTHPTGCVGLDVSVRKDQDRAVPDLVVGVTTSPGSAGRSNVHWQ